MEKGKSGKEQIMERARAAGSSATTVPGALRYLRARIKSAEREIYERPRYGYDRNPTRREDYYADRHRDRLGARYTRLGEEMMAALGLPEYDEKKDRARVNRIARQKELAAALTSDDERDLRGAGYTLTRDGSHRVLAGMDDGHPFSVQVPLRCQTLREALEWLRPDDVPADALRQGEWYFVRRNPEPETDGMEQVSEAGSMRRVEHREIETFDERARHMPTECLAVLASGETCFMGRKAVKSHAWTGRPHIFVRGVVHHPEHGGLDLGAKWHEVVPNRAHGPFAVGQLAGGID